MKNKLRESLEDVLQSTSESLFPAEMGSKKVGINSCDCQGDTPLHILISRGNVAGALLVIESGANVDAVGDMGETPLHLAVRSKNYNLIAALINKGANRNIVSEFGKSPVDEAKEIGIKLNLVV